MELKIDLQKQIKGSLWSRPPVVLKALTALPGYLFVADWSQSSAVDTIFELVDKDISYQFEEERTRLHNQENATSRLDEIRILTEKIIKQSNKEQSLDLGIEIGAVFIYNNELFYFWSGHFGLINLRQSQVAQQIETLDYFCLQAFVPSRGLGFTGREGFIYGTMSLDKGSKLVLYKDMNFNPSNNPPSESLLDAWLAQLNVT